MVWMGVLVNHADPSFNSSLGALAQRLGRSVPGLRSFWQKPEQFDFFVSYRGNDVARARRINDILRYQCKRSTLFVDKTPGEEFARKMIDGIGRCRRAVLLLTADYFDSKYTQWEYGQFVKQDIREPNDRIVVFVLDPGVEIPVVLSTYQRLNLIPYEGEAMAEQIRDWIARRDAADPWVTKRVPEARADGLQRREFLTAVQVAATAAAVVGGVGAMLNRPGLDRATQISFDLTGVDWSLPGWWKFSGARVREHVLVAGSRRPLSAWIREDGLRPLSRVQGRWIDLRGLNLLESSVEEAPGAGNRDWIAQYRLRFQRGGVTMVACARGPERYAARVEYASAGSMRAVVTRMTGRGTAELARSAVFEDGGDTMHQVALTFEAGTYAVHHGGRRVVEWRDDRLAPGAVGLEVGTEDGVRLYGWSLRAA